MTRSSNINKKLAQNKKEPIKQAWIIESSEVISFHEVGNSILYEAETDEFWIYIFELIKSGYKVQ